MTSEAVELRHQTGVALVERLPSGAHRISVRPSDETAFVSIRGCETRYPLELIDAVLSVKGVEWLCDEILRDEQEAYVAVDLKYGMFTYVPPDHFAGKRLLDFGCGSGASTSILARWLRDTEIVGVDLNEDYLGLAEARARHHGLNSVRFLLSPGPDTLPPQIGMFEFVSFSAVYEHLLPHERRTLLPLVWSVLRPSGILFINQTPNRLYPIEAHTTGLPLLNYVPAGLALRYARRSPRVNVTQSWEDLLRAGIRGGTTGEILRNLHAVDSGAKLMKPRYLGARDEIDVWYMNSGRPTPRVSRRVARVVFKSVLYMTGIRLIPVLSIAIQNGPLPVGVDSSGSGFL
jgi:2-polyprenyl-3-methyl-5-hydroxy-6-metoxy-1,4-benzoquinol methylase